jgi:ribonuclease HI
MTVERVEIFTDGACSGNPGPGGWAALLRFRGIERWMNGAEPATTNNRMELIAALRALESLKKPCEVDLTTDSQYLKHGVEKWMAGWKRNGWRTSGREPVKNRDLWEALDAVLPSIACISTGCAGMMATPRTSGRRPCTPRSAIC